MRRFNQEASEMGDLVVLCISPDLPFAHKRFCAVEGIDNVISLSTFRDPGFGETYGVTMITTQRRGLLARAIVVVDGEGRVKYNELVPELTQEPDYSAALDSVWESWRSKDLGRFITTVKILITKLTIEWSDEI